MAKDDDLVGGEDISPKGAGKVNDIIAAKMKAREREAEAEAEIKKAIAKRIRSGGRQGDVTVTTTDGGVSISGSGTHIGGSLAGRDLIGGNVTTTTGMTAEEFVKLFDVVYKRIEQLPPSVDKADVREAVDTIEAEAMQEATEGKPPEEKLVKLSAQSLISMAPDILDVIVATVANPAAGVAAVIRKVLDKAKAAGSAG